MIKIKNKNLQALYIGNRSVSRVYVGNNLVWPDGNMGLIFDGEVLPIGFTKSVIFGNLVFAGEVLQEYSLPIMSGSLVLEGYTIIESSLPIVSGNLSMEGTELQPSNNINVTSGAIDFNGIVMEENNG